MRRFTFLRLRAFWRRTTLLDRFAFAILLLDVAVHFMKAEGFALPYATSLAWLGFAAVVYFLFRILPWARSRFMWRLRNRLMVTYIFIAVVPVVLLLTMAGVASYFLCLQFGAHLLHEDLQERSSAIAADTNAIAAAIDREVEKGIPTGDEAELASPDVSSLVTAARSEWPDLQVYLNRGGRLVKAADGRPFAGLVELEKRLWIASVVSLRTHERPLTVLVAVPLTPAVLDGLTPEIGPIQLMLLEPAAQKPELGISLEFHGRVYVPGQQIRSLRRTLAPPVNWLDARVNGASTFEAAHVDPGGDAIAAPVLASFSLRPSALNRRLFTSVGALGPLLIDVLIVAGIVFLVLELAALATGVVLTRTITRAVADLYEATLHVRRGDFSHRIRIRQPDQLGALSDSFNEMTSSVAELIEEQRQRQRLENELSIAKEVQEQLFPRSLPALPGVELAAICRPARTVSGDYYDFISLGPKQLGIGLADISGKGISAALLMASLQAALRSQIMLDAQCGTAELVARLNRQLFKTTSDDRYATFFYAAYDAESKTLTYTNAGHLAPFYVADGRVEQLEQGGTVVGLFEECLYTQGTLRVAPGSVLVAFSDGLTEPENVYGEEFGVRRLKEEILRQRDLPAQRLAENLIAAAEQWAGTPDQADDITVVVARMS